MRRCTAARHRSVGGRAVTTLRLDPDPRFTLIKKERHAVDAELRMTHPGDSLRMA
ncbi:hypothetical protein [Sodalis-like endosymbiont of Proechinophthirus fluctus]|uniref:hypothetical protein n=1 Tax=Sodalis-like endosymbiont of Proechinophthirus fluctus TaxID=1462730 RepID=UPI000AEE1D20|nr:hypothetical protein [Sodalis-like endosymbiont of Proechinophthirus fluctus]